MKQIKVVKGESVYTFSINKKKYIFGNNKYNFINFFREYFNKNVSSEYSKENRYNSLIYCDGRLIDLKSSSLIEISNFSFDLINEYKLNQKSLLYMSLESIFKNDLFFELINTINILLNDLTIEIEEYYKNNDIDLIIQNCEINFKNLLKLIDISLIKEESEVNQFDFNISELNNIKLNIIEMIIKYNPQTIFYIINEDYNINLDRLLKYDNINILNFCNSNSKNIFYLDIMLDMEIEEEIYEFYLNSSSNLCYESFVAKLFERNKI